MGAGRRVDLSPLNGNWTVPFGSVKVNWQPYANETRQMIGMSNHMELHRLSLQHRAYHMELMVAKYVPDGHSQPLVYYFIDMAMSFTPEYQNNCYEGVWGRTTCVSSASKVDNLDYDLDDNLFAAKYARSQFDATP